MNVRKAADAEKRLWAVEYDVSGMPAATAYDALARDWRWLKDGPVTPARILIDLGNIRVAFPILLVIAGYAALDRHSWRPLVTPRSMKSTKRGQATAVISVSRAAANAS